MVHITGVYGEFRFQHRHVALESVQNFGLSELGAPILVWHRVHGDRGDNSTVTGMLCPVVTGASCINSMTYWALHEFMKLNLGLRCYCSPSILAESTGLVF